MMLPKMLIWFRSVVAGAPSNGPTRESVTRFTGRHSDESAEAGRVVSGQAVDLGRRELRRDRAHARVYVVAPLTRRVSLELQGEIILSLLVQDRRLDRTAGARAVTGRAGRDIAIGIAQLRSEE